MRQKSLFTPSGLCWMVSRSACTQQVHSFHGVRDRNISEFLLFMELQHYRNDDKGSNFFTGVGHHQAQTVGSANLSPQIIHLHNDYTVLS
ncbi:lactosylceramide 4-alpha-galactosyltransferase isoform X3 [Protopterus annectens]|uniref:lactosylceramide 4-alpha-galactosyltransferase isoform X3 n=1 Tax=Protopterus annectens TaxID=7888 RepID=UPI001CFA2018|nr:lactosylceramide 4-alpha-galactosyltransferase isoform X3 [Protopterus annectens]